MTGARIRQATDNLLKNCAGLQAGDSLLIVHEDPNLGWYEEPVYLAISAAAKETGVEVNSIQVGAPDNDKNETVMASIPGYDCTLFLARLGDQDRFATAPAGRKIVMSYIRNLDMLISSFGCLPYAATRDMKQALDALIQNAGEITLSCELGTDCSLRLNPKSLAAPEDVSVLRFPLGVISPIDAASLNGEIALTHYLTPTGSAVYEPASLKLDSRIIAQVENGRIIKFTGETTLVEKVEEHYRVVADRFAIDPTAIHSWHAGLHPGLIYSANANDNPDRWSNTVFNHPKFAHFHTCGNYAPGEICWMVKDPTIYLDGKALWQFGRLKPEEFDLSRSVLNQWPEMARLYQNPSTEVGL